MDFSAALFTRGSVDIARKGQNANDSVPANQIQVARVGKTFVRDRHFNVVLVLNDSSGNN